MQVVHEIVALLAVLFVQLTELMMVQRMCVTFPDLSIKLFDSKCQNLQICHTQLYASSNRFRYIEILNFLTFKK